MALLSIKASQKIDITVRLEHSTAKLVDRYAHFLKVPADDVIESALQYIFTKDKEFQQHIAQNADTDVPVGLRIKKPQTAAKNMSSGRKGATPKA